MCRNLGILFNFDPSVNDEEIRAAALQFVRKISGYNKPSKFNESAFLDAVDEMAAASGHAPRIAGDELAAKKPGQIGGQGAGPYGVEISPVSRRPPGGRRSMRRSNRRVVGQLLRSTLYFEFDFAQET